MRLRKVQEVRSLGGLGGLGEKQKESLDETLFLFFLACSLDYLTRRSGIRAFLPVRLRK